MKIMEVIARLQTFFLRQLVSINANIVRTARLVNQELQKRKAKFFLIVIFTLTKQFLFGLVPFLESAFAKVFLVFLLPFSDYVG